MVMVVDRGGGVVGGSLAVTVEVETEVENEESRSFARESDLGRYLASVGRWNSSARWSRGL